MAGIYLSESTAPSAPAAGKVVIYAKADGFLYIKDDAGTETQLTISGGAITASSFTMATSRLLGRTTASTGAIEEISVGASLTLSGGSLSGTAASTTQAGVVETATQAEVDAMTDTSRYLTPNHTKIVLATPQTPGAVSSVDFTSVPSGVRRLVLGFVGVSFANTTQLRVQLGDSGGIETTSYSSIFGTVIPTVSTGTGTTGFDGASSSTAAVYHGFLTFNLLDSSTNTWGLNGLLGRTNDGDSLMMSGTKALSGTLDRIRITNSAAVNFDAGTLTLSYER